MDSSIEVPQYFLCPISLELMRDPVTTATGITYDRRSIEQWLLVGNNSTCPVTHQPLPPDPISLTPNHTLRRLIQAWCDANAAAGVDRVPTPRAPVDRTAVGELLRDLALPGQLQLDSLNRMVALVRESESNRRCMAQAGVAGAMVQEIVSCAERKQMDRIELALRILSSLGVNTGDLKPVVDGAGHRIIDAMTWVLTNGGSGNNGEMRSTAALVLESMVDVADRKILEQLKSQFFGALLFLIRDPISKPAASRSALKALLHTCSCGRNRLKIVEAGGVRELVELELTLPEKRTTELNLCLLNHLCSCAEGRAELAGHPAGIAAVAKRILRVSPVADEQGVTILAKMCGHLSPAEVVQEMLSVGAVSKLCLILQANCEVSEGEGHVDSEVALCRGVEGFSMHSCLFIVEISLIAIQIILILILA